MTKPEPPTTLDLQIIANGDTVTGIYIGDRYIPLDEGDPDAVPITIDADGIWRI